MQTESVQSNHPELRKLVLLILYCCFSHQQLYTNYLTLFSAPGYPFDLIFLALFQASRVVHSFRVPTLYHSEIFFIWLTPLEGPHLIGCGGINVFPNTPLYIGHRLGLVFKINNL